MQRVAPDERERCVPDREQTVRAARPHAPQSQHIFQFVWAETGMVFDIPPMHSVPARHFCCGVTAFIVRPDYEFRECKSLRFIVRQTQYTTHC